MPQRVPMELNMPDDNELDIRTTGISALTPEQWDALKRHVIRRAHEERAQVISEMFARLFDWLRRSSQSTAPIVPPSTATTPNTSRRRESNRPGRHCRGPADSSKTCKGLYGCNEAR